MMWEETDEQDASEQFLLALNADEALLGEDVADDDVVTKGKYQHENISGPMYEPIETPEGCLPLTYKPLVLQRWFLIFTAVFFWLCLVGTTATIICYQTVPETFHLRTEINRSIIVYSPVAIGTITTIWWRSVTRSYIRIIPYVAMSTMHGEPSSGKFPQHLRFIFAAENIHHMFTLGFLDMLKMLREGHYLSFSIILLTALQSLVLIPLKSAFLVAKVDDTGWAVSISVQVGYALVSIYSMLAIAITAVAWRLWDDFTGLKWDPATLATQISLVQGSNVFEIFDGSDFIVGSKVPSKILQRSTKHGVLRLGYWKTAGTGHKVHYGIRFMQWNSERAQFVSPQNRQGSIGIASASCLGDVCISHKTGSHCSKNAYTSEEAPRDQNGKIVCSPEYARFEVGLNFIGDTCVLSMLLTAAASIAMLLLVAIKGSSKQEVSISINNRHSRLLLTVVPSIAINIWSSVAWIPIDIYYRRMQPVAGMYEASGPKENMLLDYISPTAPQIILDALVNGYYKVAWFCILSICNSAVAAIGGKIFDLIIFRDNKLIAKFNRTYLYICVGALLTYSISILFARPTPAFRVPRMIQNITDLVTYCYASKMVDNEEFKVRDHTDQEDHLYAKVLLAKRKYQLGMYTGTDGRRHLGFDAVVQTADSEGNYLTQNIDTFDPGKSIFFSSLLKLWWIRPSLRRATSRASQVDHRLEEDVEAQQSTFSVSETSSLTDNKVDSNNFDQTIDSSTESLLETPSIGYAIAKSDFHGSYSNDLSFRKWDVIEITNKADDDEDGWWGGRIGQRIGLFPRKYVELCGT